MRFHLVLVIIQKTKNAEPVYPVQHLFFSLIKISDVEIAGSIGVLQRIKAV
jgi:hypothetical protein